jgi:hypothetical protein
MRLQLRLLAAVVAALLVLPAAGVSAAPRHARASFRQDATAPANAYLRAAQGNGKRISLPKDYRAWSHVAQCEEGGWYAPGGNYVDALGIDDTNWYGAGGKAQYGRLSLAEQVYEIKIADRFIRAYHVGIPDQGGSCAAW